MTEHSAFIFYTVWVGLLLGPLVGTAMAVVWRRRARRPEMRILAAGVVPLVVVVLATTLGLTFVDGRVGAITFLVAYLLYCIAAFLMAGATKGLQAAFGWVLAVPTAGGVLLGTVGGIGLALIMGDHVPRNGGALGPSHRYLVTTYGNATTADGGSVVSIYRTVTWAPFVERRTFEARFDYRQVEMGTVHAEVDHGNVRRAVILSHAVKLAVGPLD